MNVLVKHSDLKVQESGKKKKKKATLNTVKEECISRHPCWDKGWDTFLPGKSQKVVAELVQQSNEC